MIVDSTKTAVAFVADVSFIVPFENALLSFAKQNSSFLHYYIFSNDINERALDGIRLRLKKTSPKAELNLIILDNNEFNSFTGFWERLGKQAFYRFKIPELLPKRFRYTIYLDVDVICLSQLGKLELKGFPIAAVRDSISDVLAPKRGLKKYFNSGFLVIDNDEWCKNEVSQKLFTIKPPKTRFADQDILNHYFKNNWLELDSKYNFPAARLPLKNLWKGVDSNKVKILHYSGPIKPWEYWMKGSMEYWNVCNGLSRSNKISFKLKSIFNSLKHIWQSRIVKKLKFHRLYKKLKVSLHN